jgi:putative endonuclease
MFHPMREHRYYVYIMASPSGTLYVGMGNSVYNRATSHKDGTGSWFTAKYECDRLVYYEVYQYVRSAIRRETQLKKWRRDRKVALIESVNPQWRDLARDWGKPLEPLTVQAKGIPRLGATAAPRSE